MASNDALLQLCDDLHQTKSGVSQLQATIALILGRTPSPETYSELLRICSSDFNIDPELSALVDRTKGYLYSTQIKVGVRLKYLFENHRLPFFELIQKINFKLGRPDKYVTELMDYVPPEPTREGDEKHVPLTEAYPPALPLVAQDYLIIRATTDKLFRLVLDFIELLEHHDFARAHNAKMAVRGRLVLQVCLEQILDDAYPEMDAEELVWCREQAMNPALLARFALGYNLIDSFKYQGSVDLPADTKIHMMANVFLAYIEAMVEDGYSVGEVGRWVKKLFAPVVADLDSDPVHAQVAANELKVLTDQLSHHLVKLNYHEFEDTELGVHVCEISLVDGENSEPLIVGTDAEDLALAKAKAAKAVMENPQAVSKVVGTMLKHYLANTVTQEPLTADYAGPPANVNSAHFQANVNNPAVNPQAPIAQLKLKLDKDDLTATVVVLRVANNDYFAHIMANGITIGEGVDLHKRTAVAKAAKNALARTESFKTMSQAQPAKPKPPAALNY